MVVYTTEREKAEPFIWESYVIIHTASSGTITKKLVSFSPFETVGTKNIFYVVIFVCVLIRLRK